MRARSIIGKIMIGVSLAIFVVLWASMALTAFTDTELTTLDPRGPSARSIQDLVGPVFIIAGVVFVAVLGVVFWASVHYRDKGEDDETPIPKQLHGKTALEIGWTIAPAAILAVVAVLTVFTIVDLNEEEPNALKVEVSGQQWWWAYRYDMSNDGAGNGRFDDPEDIVTATELVVPVGRSVDLTVTSNDVIHSFWIPALNGKRDAVPGLLSDSKLEADAPGVFRGQCTEYCGLSHANMRMLVRAVEPDAFDAWAAGQQQTAPEPTTELAQEGKSQFENICAGCHLINGVNNEQLAESPPSLVAGIAPDLTHLMSRGTFAGSIYNLHYPNPPEAGDQPFGATCSADDLSACGDPTDVAEAGNPDNPFYPSDLEAWLRDAPSMKPMAPDDNRGMPNLGLTEDQIDALIAYLTTLQ